MISKAEFFRFSSILMVFAFPEHPGVVRKWYFYLIQTAIQKLTMSTKIYIQLLLHLQDYVEYVYVARPLLGLALLQLYFFQFLWDWEAQSLYNIITPPHTHVRPPPSPQARKAFFTQSCQTLKVKTGVSGVPPAKVKLIFIFSMLRCDKDKTIFYLFCGKTNFYL